MLKAVVCASSTIEGIPLPVVQMIYDYPTEAEADSEAIKALARAMGSYVLPPL